MIRLKTVIAAMLLTVIAAFNVSAQTSRTTDVSDAQQYVRSAQMYARTELMLRSKYLDSKSRRYSTLTECATNAATAPSSAPTAPPPSKKS